MSYNIEESSSSSASSDADEGWGGVAEVMGDEEEQKVLFQALDSFQYVPPGSGPSLAIYSSTLIYVSNVVGLQLVDARDIIPCFRGSPPLVLQELIVCE